MFGCSFGSAHSIADQAMHNGNTGLEDERILSLFWGPCLRVDPRYMNLIARGMSEVWTELL